MVEVKLQRHLAYKYKDKTRYKYVIVIPNETVKDRLESWRRIRKLRYRKYVNVETKE
ncbi:MAG: hypothetical protein JSV12_04255 [Candidatus Bathyarchaeota archaeon]|nr:MAG: hypothetical protein JSV12_04255 [Candidatus Bathyarchaeota archaeon]